MLVTTAEQKPSGGSTPVIDMSASCLWNAETDGQAALVWDNDTMIVIIILFTCALWINLEIEYFCESFQAKLCTNCFSSSSSEKPKCSLNALFCWACFMSFYRNFLSLSSSCFLYVSSNFSILASICSSFFVFFFCGLRPKPVAWSRLGPESGGSTTEPPLGGASCKVLLALTFIKDIYKNLSPFLAFLQVVKVIFW